MKFWIWKLFPREVILDFPMILFKYFLKTSYFNICNWGRQFRCMNEMCSKRVAPTAEAASELKFNISDFHHLLRPTWILFCITFYWFGTQDSSKLVSLFWGLFRKIRQKWQNEKGCWRYRSWHNRKTLIESII
jgi:hypothetical protein